jgi:hypothetical protein
MGWNLQTLLGFFLQLLCAIASSAADDGVVCEARFYSPEARVHACVVPASGHDLSLAVNLGLQAADAVAWSTAFVDQLDLGERRRPCSSNENELGLPWNDGLPWNCGAVSAGSR